MMTWPAHAIGRSAGAEIVSVLRSLYKNFHILDTSFPMLTFSWLYEDVTAVFHPERVENPAERQFYSRFRQAGGHTPLLRLSDLGPYSFSRPVRADEAAKTAIIACHSSDCPALLDFLGDVSPSTTLLVNEPDKDDVMRARLAQIGFVGMLTVRFIRPGHSEVFRLIARKVFDRQMVNRILTASKNFAVNVGFGMTDGDHSEPLIEIQLPRVGYQPPTIALSPRRLIHDGARLSEGTEDYSWLWVDKERQIRFLLGYVPQHFNRVRVIVPNAVTTANLKTARLALNGEVVEPSIDIWREGSGAVSTPLSHHEDGDQVLGFSVAHAQSLEAGAALLAACVDRIEFQA